ncbi:MAG: S-layer homology domain-containing protein, partial [Phascolarctobacterium succinatutens]|nr:S-layer homology domain-containing protein [Phascolarctobacterium succinatutens]
MKKSLVLAMAMALGVTASAYAANPFSDVPAGHWAYDSINKLAAAGVIEGYGDSTFGGDKLMTRYEMAQIVAKAMAKGANVDKLAAEFADELDNLGVRVAALEKKADNVKITGQIRYEYAGRDGDLKKTKGSVALNRLRTRLFVNGAINDDWTYTARIQNDQNFKNDAGDETTKFNQAYVTGRVGGLAVVAGKAPILLAEGNLYDDTAEFVSVSYGKDVKLTAYAGQPTDYGFDDFYGASLAGNVGKLALSAGYDAFKDSQYAKNDKGVLAATGNNSNVKEGEDNNVWNVTAKYAFDKNISLNAAYLNSDIESDNLVKGADTDGFVVGLDYKGAKAKQAGSWGLWGKY